MIECPDCEEYLRQIDKLEPERDRLRERLDQYEAYAITVDGALRDRNRLVKLEEALREFDGGNPYSNVYGLAARMADALRALLAATAEAEARCAELERDRREVFALKGAAEEIADRYEAALREIADCQHRYVQTGYSSEAHYEDECGPCIARAALAGQEVGRE